LPVGRLTFHSSITFPLLVIDLYFPDWSVRHLVSRVWVKRAWCTMSETSMGVRHQQHQHYLQK
jgi:hypothetical protein